MADLKATAQVLRDNCEVVVVAGIGGSYLGARAVIEALSNSFQWLKAKQDGPVIVFAGHNIGEDYLYELTSFFSPHLIFQNTYALESNIFFEYNHDNYIYRKENSC